MEADDTNSLEFRFFPPDSNAFTSQFYLRNEALGDLFPDTPSDGDKVFAGWYYVDTRLGIDTKLDRNSCDAYKNSTGGYIEVYGRWKQPLDTTETEANRTVTYVRNTPISLRTLFPLPENFHYPATAGAPDVTATYTVTPKSGAEDAGAMEEPYNAAEDKLTVTKAGTFTVTTPPRRANAIWPPKGTTPLPKR